MSPAPGLRARLRLGAVVTALFATLLAACPPPTGMTDAALPLPRITRVDMPMPALPGTVLRITGVDLDRLGTNATLDGIEDGSTRFTLSRVPNDQRGELLFQLTRTALESIGAGTHSLTLVAVGRGLQSEPFPVSVTFALTLPLALGEGLNGDVHRNDVVVLDGAGFVSPDEGSLVLHVTGMFTRMGASAVPVDARLPLFLVDRNDRARAVVVLSTDLGGPFPGTLEGMAQVERSIGSGSAEMTATQAVSLRFLPPELYAFDGSMASVGRLVTVRGAGFLGGPDRPTETTLFRIEGMFTPQGGSATPFTGELVPRFVSGSEVRVAIETEVRDGVVVSRLFGAQRGAFAGTATPITLSGTSEVPGATIPFALVLGPPVQAVQLRFLPGYYDSLARFGLASAEDEIAAGIERRIEDIYADYNVDVYLESPVDFDRGATTIIEIGGPDPNGNGLFGYDNSPGKDIGNVRMGDSIGGTNAETQEDGYPGYGGVFVESLLYWSNHPDLPGGRPPSSPDPESLFDDIFDPVRAQPATHTEIEGVGDPERVREVRRAIEALSSIIGETTSHELGHSLGMAQPFGPATSFHRTEDGDGCLMDRGGERPLGERSQQPGFARTRFCDDEPAYLQEILGN
jgi:hypothetical protein